MLTRRPWAVLITRNLQLLVLESESSLVIESRDKRMILEPFLLLCNMMTDQMNWRAVCQRITFRWKLPEPENVTVYHAEGCRCLHCTR